jgi:hypothetical protein
MFELVNRSNKQLVEFPIFVQLATVLGISPVAVAVAGVLAAFFSLSLLLDIGTYWILDLATFAYPMYRTFEVLLKLEGGTLKNGDMAVKILHYWVVIGSMKVVEGPLDFFLCWIPFYGFLRIALVWWLASSGFNNSEKIFTLLKPQLVNLKEFAAVLIPYKPNNTTQ